MARLARARVFGKENDEDSSRVDKSQVKESQQTSVFILGVWVVPKLGFTGIKLGGKLVVRKCCSTSLSWCWCGQTVGGGNSLILCSWKSGVGVQCVNRIN